MTETERSEVLWRRVNNLLPHERGVLFGHVWGRYEGHPDEREFFLDAVSEWLDRRYPPNLLECPTCLAHFHDTDQSRNEQDNGMCPGCGYEGVRPVEAEREIIRTGGQ